MFSFLSNLIYRRRWLFLLAGVSFLILSAVYGTSLFDRLKAGGFTDPDAESTRAAAILHQQLGRDERTLVVLFTGRDSMTVDDPNYRQAVEATLSKVQGQPGVGSITTYYQTLAPQFASFDRKSTYALVGLLGDDDAQEKSLETLRPLLDNDHLHVQLGGYPATAKEINEQVLRDLETAELATFPIVAILLVLIFRSLLSSALPLAIGGLAILGSFLVLSLASNFTDVSIFALNVSTMLGLGLAIDYSLFIVSRFREQLEYNNDVASALTETMETAGRTVFFSGLTVAISLSSITLFPQMFLKSMGLGGSAVVLMAMVAALTVLPAALAVLGPKVNSLSVAGLLRPPRRDSSLVRASNEHGLWYQASKLVMRRPGTVLILTAVPLLALGIPFTRVNFSFPDARVLPKTHESRQVSDILSTDFPTNETQPIQLVVYASEPITAPLSLGALYDYTRQVAAVPGVRRVDSMVTLDPQMDKAAYESFYAIDGTAPNPLSVEASQRFARGNYTLVNVLYDSEPFSSASQELVKQIRTLSVPNGMNVLVGGDAAFQVDLLSSLGRTIPWAFALIITVLFVLLFLMLGSLVVPLKAVILNILSLSVSFGALVWVFQEGNLADLLGFTPTGSIDATQPVLIFALAFGLSMDYEVFLLSRIKEHYDRTHDNTASVAFGVQKTGAIITSAALLLVVVIGAFTSGQVMFIKQIGVGLGLAILVDATIVRLLLVPAAMRLMGAYNWWAPHWLITLHQRIGFNEVERDQPTTYSRRAAASTPLDNVDA